MKKENPEIQNKPIDKNQELNQLLAQVSLNKDIPTALYAATAQIISLFFKIDESDL
jgi:type III secretion system FlhB-like substrate exporter